MTLLYLLIVWTVMCGFASLGVDFGRVQLAKTEFRSAADAAVRAGSYDLPNGVTTAQNSAISIASQNRYDGNPLMLNPATEILFGIWDPTARTFTQLTGSAKANSNAIRIVAMRPIPLTFAKLLGVNSINVNIKSTACLTGNAGAYSIIGINGITMSSSAYTDSYDASSGAYSAASANHRGAIASNGNIALSGSVKVDGDARCGIGKTTTLGTATVTGLNAPLGCVMNYPSVALPASYVDLGDVNMNSGTSSLGGGTYLIHNLNLGGSAHVIWTGPVVLYIRDSYTVSGSTLIDTYQNLPKNRILNFLPTCTTATWSGSNVNVGELYAPDTDFTIGGSVSLHGRVTAKTINNSSSGGMHYDESLSPPGATAARESVQIVQ
jgi:Flp pilus assembly protein TadG